MNTEIRIAVYHKDEHLEYRLGRNISKEEFDLCYRKPEEPPYLKEMPVDRATFEYLRFQDEMKRWESNVEHLSKEIAMALTAQFSKL